MRFIIRLFAVACLAIAAFSAGPASAEKRVALVIGNGAYARVGKLTNPTSDAAAMEGLHRTAGFDAVEVKTDLGGVAMRRALRDFSYQVTGADIAVVFYAGHGIEMDGINYLIPVDAMLERDVDVKDKTVSLERVTEMIDGAKRLRLVIIDACRDNPFVRTMKRSGRSVGRGLARVEVMGSDTLIAFAAKHGSTAADGETANSPYTAALVKHLPTPGLDLRLALGRVRDEVLASTGNRQEPFVYGSLGGTEIALVPGPKLAVVPPPMPLSEIERDWAAVKDTSSVAMLEAFAVRHKGTFYATLAQVRIDELKRIEESKKVVAVPPQSTPAAPPAPVEVKQIKLSAQQVEGFIASHKEMTAALERVSGDKLDTAIQFQINSIVRKFGFKDFSEYDDVAANVAMVMAGIDPATKVFTDPKTLVKKELDSVMAHKTLSEKDRKQLVGELREALKTVQPIMHQSNVDLVKRYFDKIEPLLQ